MSQFSDQLDPRLWAALEQLKTVPPRDPEAAARGRANFLAYAKSLQPPVSKPINLRHTGWSNLFSRRWSTALLAIFLLVVAALVAGTAGTVYAAQDSLPATPLYPVKILSEDTQIALAFQLETKLDLYLRFSNRRVDEIVALNRQGIVPPESVASRLYQELDRAQELVTELPDSGLAQPLGQIVATIQHQNQTLTEIQTQATEPNQAFLAQVQMMLNERLKLGELGLTDPASFRLRMRELNNPTTSSGQDDYITATPTELERRSTATPTQEYHPSITPAPTVRPTATPLAQDVYPTSTSPVQVVYPTATPAEQQVRPTITPPEQGAHPTATSPRSDPHPSQTPAKKHHP